MLPRMITLPAACGLALALQIAAAAPPVAEIRNSPATHHGTTVDDPYRWLEDTAAPPVQAWLKAQGAEARSVLDRIDGRDAIARRLGELAQAQGDAVRDVTRMPGDRIYYLKRARGQSQFKLVVRQGLGGAEHVLVDPRIQARRSGVPHAVNYYAPSWDGAHVAYGMSAGGSENASLHVLHVASGRVVGAPIPRVSETPLHWLPDSRSLTATQLPRLAPDAPATDTYKDSRVLWLRLGAPAAPKAVFGPTVSRRLGLDRLDVAELITVPGSRWMVARTTDTTVPEGKLFVAPLSDLGRADMRWRRLAGEADKVVDVALRGEHLYVLTQGAAPRRKVVRIDLARGDLAGELAGAEAVADEPADGVIEAFVPTPAGVVTQVRQGTSMVLRRHAAGDTAGRTMPAPGSGVTRLTRAPAHDSEALLVAFQSWTEPLRWLQLQQGDALVDAALGVRAVPPGLPAIEVTDIVFPSHDGVAVPMTVLHRRGLPLDGRNPVLVHGYGSYGFSIPAHYTPENVAWIERGGVLAFVNVRGSGVHGDAWHRAGFKSTKPNTWKDGIAAARTLVARGYGSPKTMGIVGRSAGGIFAGRAATEAPELFAAAVFDVASLDTVRQEDSANGATNVSEFGTVRNEAEFRALLAMSTYHAVENGTAYPGVLLMHGMNDPRVEVWHSAKTAARLQAASPGGRPVLLRLDAQAGHGVGNTLSQQHAQSADMQSFLLWQMGKAALRD